MNRKRLNKNNAVYTPVSGTTILINYSIKSHILEVEFAGGRVYHYYKVDPLLWEEYKSIIKLKGSSGSFVNTRIKPFFEDEEVT